LHKAADGVAYVGADLPSLEGVISDDRVAVRWLIPVRSISVWDSFAALLAVHGHPGYAP
jgi:hypothetical protein